MAVVVREVRTKKDLDAFIKFKHTLYKGNKYAAPPLFMDDRLNLSREENPAFEFCEAAYFLFYKDDKIAGRVAAIINPLANQKWGVKHARFGWVDFIDDYEVSKTLFDTVEDWARKKGMEAVNGPLGFTDLDQEGMLVEGFDKKGTLASIYNYPYYPEHLARHGYIKDNDWVEYLITIPGEFPEKYFRIADIVKQKYNLTIKQFRSKKEVVRKYGKKIFELINSSYKDLYGYSNLNEKQIDFYIKLYLTFIRLDCISVVVDESDEVIAMGISIPSLTDALQKAKGRLFPIGWIYMLKALYLKNDVIDLYLMAVRPDYQNKGVNSLMFAQLMPNYAKNGYKFAESNSELEDNTKMSSQWGSFEYVQHKRRRAFIKKI